MAQKRKKPHELAVEELRVRFEERFFTSFNTDSEQSSWMVRRNDDGTYQNPEVQNRWLGFLLAYDKGKDGLTLHEPTPTVQKAVVDMRAIADARLAKEAGDALGLQLHALANQIEARPDGIYEDVYEQLTNLIEPFVKRELINEDGPFPASVVETMPILLEHWSMTRGSSAVLIADAAKEVVSEALGNTEVHPCDVNDVDVRAKKLYGPMLTLYEALTRAGLYIPIP